MREKNEKTLRQIADVYADRDIDEHFDCVGRRHGGGLLHPLLT